MYFLGHEIGHASGYREEQDAVKIGKVAAFSLQVYEQMFVPDIPKKPA